MAVASGDTVHSLGEVRAGARARGVSDVRYITPVRNFAQLSECSLPVRTLEFAEI